MRYPVEIMRFILSDLSVVSFYDTGNDIEIHDVKYYPRVTKVDISVDRFGKAHVITPGLVSYKVFDITFNLIPFNGSDGLTKLNLIYDDVDIYFNPSEIKLYWHYDENTDDYVWVSMKREMFIREFTMGDVAKKDMRIIFMEVKDVSVPDSFFAYNPMQSRNGVVG